MSFTKLIHFCSPSFNIENVSKTTVNFLRRIKLSYAGQPKLDVETLWGGVSTSSPFVPGNDNTSLILVIDLSLFSVRKLSHTCIDETEETQKRFILPYFYQE